MNDGNAHELDAHAGRARTVPSTQSVYPEPEVTQKPVRRQFTAEYKLRILQEAERCTPSERGALLRREGLYSSILTKWHRQSKRGAQEALAAKQRGPKGASPQDLEIAELKEKVAKLEKALQQAHAIIDLQKNRIDIGNSSQYADRTAELIASVTAVKEIVPIKMACSALGLPRSTLYKQLQPKRPPAVRSRSKPPRALTEEERKEVLEVLHSPNQLRHPTYKRPELLATSPNQLWSWDITKLKGPCKYSYFYLYVIMDVFSRYVVGWSKTIHLCRATDYPCRPRLFDEFKGCSASVS